MWFKFKLYLRRFSFLIYRNRLRGHLFLFHFPLYKISHFFFLPCHTYFLVIVIATKYILLWPISKDGVPVSGPQKYEGSSVNPLSTVLAPHYSAWVLSWSIFADSIPGCLKNELNGVCVLWRPVGDSIPRVKVPADRGRCDRWEKCHAVLLGRGVGCQVLLSN